jgi:hypothetical protein
MQKNREKLAYFFLASSMALALLAPGWALDKFLFGLDTFTLHLPFLLYAKKVWALFHGLPLWMPDIYMGMPAIDAANLMFFYPTNLFFALLPIPAEQTYLMDLLIHMAAAGLGMFLFLRRHDIEKQAAYFGAFVYMFSGPLLTGVYNGHWNDIKAIALIPFVFYFMNRAIKERAVFFYLSAGFFMALQIMGLGMQLMAYTYMAVLMYAVYLLAGEKPGKKEMTGVLLMFAAMTAAAALFSAPQFFPSQEYMKFSWRAEFSYAEFTDHSFNPGESIVFLLPGFFGLKDGMYWGFFPGIAMSYYCGLLPFLLGPFAFARGKHRNASIFFLVLAVFFMIMAFGGNTQLYKLLYHIPVFNRFRNPASALCMLPFMLSFLAAAGLSSIIGEDGEKIHAGRIFKKVFTASTGVAAVFLAAAAGDKFLKGLISVIYAATRGRFTSQPMSPENLSYIAGLIRQDALYFALVCGMFSGLMYFIVKNKIRPAIAISVLFCLVQLADMYRVEKKFISYETVRNVAPLDGAAAYMKNDRTLFRYADLDFTRTINSNMYLGLESFIGFHAILHGKIYNLLANDMFKHVNVMRLFNVKYYLNPYYQEDYKTWGFKEVVSGPVKLFEDPLVLQRAFLTDKIRKLSGDDEILAYMKTGEFDPAVALVKDDLNMQESPEKLVSSAVITEYSPNRIKIQTSSNKDAMLVLSNMYYHRWRAKTDGMPRKIYNIDYALTGMPVAAGKHETVFYYDWSYIVFFTGLALAAFLAYLAAGYLYFRKKKD